MASIHPFFTKKTILPALLTLMLLTLIPAAAAEAITIKTDKDAYNPGDAVTVSGTATANGAVSIQMWNPGNLLVGVAQAITDSLGAYKGTILTFPSTATATFPYGDYKIKATDAPTGLSAEKTITFKAPPAPPTPPPPPPVVGALTVQVDAGEVHFPAEIVRIFILVQNPDGILVDAKIGVIDIYKPDGTKDSITTAAKSIEKGWWYVDYTIPARVGVYGVHASAVFEKLTGHGQASFEVSTSFTRPSDLEKTQSALVDKIGAAQSAITAAQTKSENTITTSITGAQKAVIDSLSGVKSSLESSIAKVDAKPDIAALKTDIATLSGNLATISSGVAQSTTFILVVAVLAFVTLVLELVILARKVK